MKTDYPIRLQSYLAKSGFGSRRSCEKLIQEGRVTINLKKVTTLGTKVEEDDVVMVDSQLAEIIEKAYYYLLHKPKGYVSTNWDPNENLYARDLITVDHKDLLFSIGRLDKDSTGLIIFTNDGESANKIMHPSFGIEKEYAVQTKENIDRRHLEEALKGLKLDEGRPYRINRFTLKSKRWVFITLIEGKNREIRKIFDHFGYTIDKLIRIRIGTIHLDNLEVGQYRVLSKGEIKALLEGKSESRR
ncbi:MAG: pseudouridine synthase [Sphaerochaetaceae bacterium]|nr:pseudouridine synthase [Sphaerochaetaceae bacterium]